MDFRYRLMVAEERLEDELAYDYYGSREIAYIRALVLALQNGDELFEEVYPDADMYFEEPTIRWDTRNDTLVGR